MTVVTVAAVQAAYVLMDREATLTKVERLVGGAAAARGRPRRLPRSLRAGNADLDGLQVPIWDGDEELVRPPRRPGRRRTRQGRPIGRRGRPRSRRLPGDGGNEREPHGTTIYNTLLYFGPDGRLLNKHRKLMPTGAERTVWGMGDGSTLDVVPTELGRLGGLICWENYMPLARFHLYAQGVEIWVAPTLAPVTAGSRPCATSPAKADCG